MISKIIHYEKYSNLQDVEFDVFKEQLYRQFKETNKQEIIVHEIEAKGTLGLVFEIEIDGVRFFAKTHKPSSFHRSNLDKEYFLLKSLYGNAIYLKKILLNLDKMNFSIILMDKLDTKSISESFDIKTEIIKGLSKKLNSCELNAYRLKYLVNSAFNYNTLFEKGIFSLEYLFKWNLISQQFSNRLAELFQHQSLVRPEEEVVCHGDLSNKNILFKGEEAFIIDWEDAISASPKYDLCYWLTFMDQRKYYNSPVFRDLIKTDPDILYLMSLILVLKGYLSVLDGSIIEHKVSVRERIEELFDYA